MHSFNDIILERIKALIVCFNFEDEKQVIDVAKSRYNKSEEESISKFLVEMKKKPMKNQLLAFKITTNKTAMK